MGDMDLREYREYSRKKHGEKALNDSMLRTMEKAIGGKKISREQWDGIHSDIKVKGAIDGDAERRR